MKNFIWINLGVFAAYTCLYFLFSDEPKEGFPVQWAVYFSVHGLGLWILSTVQRVIKNFEFSSQCLKSGSLIFLGGWVFTTLVFLI
jgi:hypothetical protein